MTQDCIDSVFEKTSGMDFEVILVDNGSTDGSKEHFEKDKRITYVYSKENLGFGRANNLGYVQAKGDYLLLLNSDTYLVNNAVYLLWKGFKEENGKKGDVVCAGCMLRDADGKIVHSYAKFPSKRKSILQASIYVILWKLHLLKSMPSTNNYDYDNKKSNLIFDVDYITGADLVVRKDIADKCGLFDPDFFMYYEESEMEHRFMKQGLRRIIINGPKIVHLEGKSNEKHSPKRMTMLMESHSLYFKKTTPKSLYYAFILIYKVAYLFTYILCFPFVHGSCKEKMEHIGAMIIM